MLVATCAGHQLGPGSQPISVRSRVCLDQSTPANRCKASGPLTQGCLSKHLLSTGEGTVSPFHGCTVPRAPRVWQWLGSYRPALPTQSSPVPVLACGSIACLCCCSALDSTFRMQVQTGKPARCGPQETHRAGQWQRHKVPTDHTHADHQNSLRCQHGTFLGL